MPIVADPAWTSRYGVRIAGLTTVSMPFRFVDTYGYDASPTRFWRYGMPSSKLWLLSVSHVAPRKPSALTVGTSWNCDESGGVAAKESGPTSRSVFELA